LQYVIWHIPYFKCQNTALTTNGPQYFNMCAVGIKISIPLVIFHILTTNYPTIYLKHPVIPKINMHSVSDSLVVFPLFRMGKIVLTYGQLELQPALRNELSL
jgi:hypothetical protein